MMNLFRAVIFASVIGMVRGAYYHDGTWYNTCGDLANDWDVEDGCETEGMAYDSITSSTNIILHGNNGNTGNTGVPWGGGNGGASDCCISVSTLLARLNAERTNNVCASGSGQSDACDQRILAEYNKTQIIALYNKGNFDTCA